MVAPLLGALTRAGARSIGRKVARKATRPSDAIYNARRRFTRAAQREYKAAQNLTGTARDIRLNLAEEYTKKAMSLYSNDMPLSRMSKGIQQLNKELNLNRKYAKKNERIRDINKQLNVRKKIRDEINEVTGINDAKKELNRKLNLNKKLYDRLINQSKQALSGNADTDERRDYEAKIIMSGPIGNSIYAAFQPIWMGADDVNQAIIDYLGVKDLMGVIEKISGKVDLFKTNKMSDDERYDYLRELIINKFIIGYDNVA